MINTLRINAVLLFKRKVSGFLADGGRDVLANTEEDISKHREKYGILSSFDNYSGIECHFYLLPLRYFVFATKVLRGPSFQFVRIGEGNVR